MIRGMHACWLAHSRRACLPVPGGPGKRTPFTWWMPSRSTTPGGSTREAKARLKICSNCRSRPPMPSFSKLNSRACSNEEYIQQQGMYGRQQCLATQQPTAPSGSVSDSLSLEIVLQLCANIMQDNVSPADVRYVEVSMIAQQVPGSAP